jgi:pimeloyl-ACP methyl ester carboxylesterase
MTIGKCRESRESLSAILVSFMPKLIVIVLATMTIPTPARAGLDSLKSSCVTKHAVTTSGGGVLPYRFCDDKLPPLGVGGRVPNLGVVNAVAVPESYDGFVGLPAKKNPAEPFSGADQNGDIALDIDVSMPCLVGTNDCSVPKPPNGYPLIVMMHGCCWGDKTVSEAQSIDATDERWHYSNAWFAARGYVVLTFTSRGFVDSSGTGSTGESQLDSRLYEVNDYQYLAGLLADDPFFQVDPKKVVVTGGSMGGGLAWMALTDPTWKSPGGKAMSLVAVAPRYGWTDLLYSLVPTGTHLRGTPGDPPVPYDGSASRIPYGFVKQSIMEAFYAQSKFVLPIPDSSSRATFALWVDKAFLCLNARDPIESNPFCKTFREKVAPGFINDRSAYYQNDFFQGLTSTSNPIQPVPVFSAGTFTDPLFTAVEHRRMVDRLKSTVPGYPVQEYYGDYAHFVQDKPKEWADLCGANHDPCLYSDYSNGLNNPPPQLYRIGVTTMLNNFIDYYATPPGSNPSLQKPKFDVTASLQICPINATSTNPKDEPGPPFNAPSFGDLAPNTLKVAMSCSHKRHTANTASPNPHALSSDPLLNFLQNPPVYCVVEHGRAGSGVITYQSVGLSSAFTMIGRTRLTVIHTGSGKDVQLNARMYDVFNHGEGAQLVDRGVRRVTDPKEKTIFDLNGNGWRFEKDHSIRIELTQDDAPYVKRSDRTSELSIGDPQNGITLEIPVRETSATISGSCK